MGRPRAAAAGRARAPPRRRRLRGAARAAAGPPGAAAGQQGRGLERLNLIYCLYLIINPVSNLIAYPRVAKKRSYASIFGSFPGILSQLWKKEKQY